MDNTKKVIVLGKFDGVHIGHKKLILKAVEIAERENLKTLIYAMENDNTFTITNRQEKEEILKILGADEVIIKTLDMDFMSMEPNVFVKNVLKEELSASWVVVGNNFRFGKNRSADAKDLKNLCNENHINAVVMDMVCVSDEPVSSTLIRTFIENGEVHKAMLYLGRPYSIKSKVSQGKHLGVKLGFPTANIYPSNLCLVPKKGVYATKTIIDGKEYKSITNVGTNPTFETDKEIKIETHIFECEKTLYGKEIQIDFVHYIRSEQKFQNENELILQVEKDKEEALKRLS